jgi:ABC-type transport system involved in cytochrome bd biosynthesis fused ATPase/permease subunit
LNNAKGHLPGAEDPNLGIEIQINTANNEGTFFKINPGQKVGICAVPGSGRTKLLKAILGETHSGYKVLLNGISSTQIAPEYIGECTSICFHHSDLFEGTIAENIVLHGTVDYTRLLELGAVLNLNSFISERDGGWDEKIDAEDLLVPNSIVKKILLARCLYQNKKLILIDDIWSVFNKNEITSIMQHIQKLSSSAIIISNYKTVLEDLDTVLYTESLKISELGSGAVAMSNPQISSIVWS